MPNEILEVLNIISGSVNYNGWIYDNIKDHMNGHILDIGSGTGNIADYFASNRKITKITLSDNSDEMVAQLERRFSNRDKYSIVKLDICDKTTFNTLPLSHIDTIAAVNVIEHISDDLAALKNIYKILRKNGALIIIVPGLPSIYGTLDQLAGHYRRYTKKTLNAKLNEADFFIREQYYMNFLGVFTWVLSGKLFKHTKFSKNTCMVLDKIVPFLEKAERRWKPPFGQSIVTICGT